MELSISSPKCSMFTMVDICKMLPDCNAQVSTTCSVKDGIIECGYIIKFIDYPQNIVEIWDILKQTLDLKCAFITKPGQYQGCIQNWPNVFVPTQCKSKIKNSSSK